MKGHLCLLGDANSVHVQRWSREMRARGWRVSLVTARPQPIEGVEQLLLAPVRRSADWLLRVLPARRLLRALKPDLVHAHYLSSYGFLGACSGCRPLVMTAWGSDLLVTPQHSAAMRALTGWTLRRADLVTADSNDLVDAAKAYRPSAPVERVHWGVDLARFGPAPWESKPGFGIASLRSWEPNYRIDTLIEAFAILRRGAPDAKLHLLGGGSLEAALRAQVAALGLEGSTVFHGRVGDAQMQATLAACKVSVTVPESDATSVAMLESMACALPIVASDLPANHEWLDGAGNRFVSAGDADALASALRGLLLDDAGARRAGEANRARIEREGRREAQMDRVGAMYGALLARRAA